MTLEFEPPNFFQDLVVPNGTNLAGWSALTYGLNIDAPVRNPACVSEHHIRGSQRREDVWTIYDKRYRPDSNVFSHLAFAMRHEVIDLLVLKRVFNALDREALQAFIVSAPNGQINRKVWFFYELLTGEKLDIEDAGNISAIDALDPERYITGSPILSRRHRVRDNLLGGRNFCPIVQRTPNLVEKIDRNLSRLATNTVGRTGQHLIARAASFLLLADSKASFEIEGERPPRNRLERWGRAILQAGKRSINEAEICRLHTILLGDNRFTEAGYRTEGVFLGERDLNEDPLPEFIGARNQDLESLMAGLERCDARLRESAIDPVLHATIIAFGFVYIHPLEDGNGRLHRYLIHHVLAERRFTPPGIVFPVSSVMLDEIDTYRQTLQAHSGPLMDFIEWRATPDHNVEVLNDTSDLYAYFDATDAAEFLYSCVQRTVEEDLPREIAYLSARDEAQRRIMEYVEMPDRMAANLITFIRQNGGTLPNRRRRGDFSALSDEEVAGLETLVAEAFGDFDDAGFT